MRTILAAVILMAGGTAFAVTFNATNGTGGATTAEIDTLIGPLPPRTPTPEFPNPPTFPPQSFNVSFTAVRTEYYNVAVQYDGMTLPMVATSTINATVKADRSTAGQIGFVGYGQPMRMNPIPAPGDFHIFSYGGRTVTGKIVSASYSNYDTSVLCFHAVLGWRRAYP